jgi:hypothetical protein
MIKKLLIPLLFLSFSAFCQEQKTNVSLYPRSIGNIEFDPNLDKKDFQLCRPNIDAQYYSFEANDSNYDGDKIKIEKEFKEKYKSQNVKKESGLIRVRFIVNCKGETDRFRVNGMDENYQEKAFDKSITDQLLQVVKSLKGWMPKNFTSKTNEVFSYDYYQYLIFKIKDGQITEILP